MSLTQAQQQAIAARGNVLVVAGAGTGKTRTLVERCLDCLLRESPRTSLDEVLMISFTEAAAAEMRERIRNRLEQEQAQHPEDDHWPEQLALFETAHIGTLHSFCLELVRRHFHELALDPQVTVLAEEEARLLADETLDGVLAQYYEGEGAKAEAVRELIQAQGRGWDKPVRTLVLRLHHCTQTLPDPEGWIQAQLELFAAEQPQPWPEWLLQAVADWRERWLPSLEQMEGDVARECARALKSLERRFSRTEAAAALKCVTEAPEACPRGKKGAWVDPLEECLRDAAFLLSLAQTDAGGADPLLEDWGWVRRQMTTVLELAREFTTAFSQAKRELGVADFHDLEQHTLRLLWDNRAQAPTAIARHWREKLRFVFVDEYQDINAAQDKILEALSRAGTEANRFLVGDIKQSIYRFRLANPRIFQRYIETWGKDGGTAIALTDNFRSREAILSFINSLFSGLMTVELGGLPYDNQAKLRFGAPDQRRSLSVAARPQPCVELHLRVKDADDPEDADEEVDEATAELLELEEAAKEARLVAGRLRQLKQAAHPIWDEELGDFRPVEWRDMAVLLRAPARKAESYAKEFSRLNVPLHVARGGFYDSLEISDLLSLLQVLDNPLQDLPVVALLRSPLVGLTLDELAQIRLTLATAHFWTALVQWRQAAAAKAKGVETPPAALTKVTQFLGRFSRWRKAARQFSLSRCLETVLAETHYADWLPTQPRGEQRHANVQRLLALAQRFDEFQRQGLFRFLRFIEAQRESQAEPEVPATEAENAVRLMSIHQSKGLEFPVVAAADLGKPFNLADLRAEVILDEQYGLCPQIKPPHTEQRYPSLPYWLARARQRRELLDEELRLLYVALTRARDTLLLSAGISASQFAKTWRAGAAGGPFNALNARSYADWVGAWFAQHAGPIPEGLHQGETALLRWTVHDKSQLMAHSVAPEPTAAAPEPAVGPEDWSKLSARLAWRYPFGPATRQPAKTSVTMLRRRAAENEEAFPGLPGRPASPNWEWHPRLIRSACGDIPRPKASAEEIGNAHHRFLQLVNLERTGNLAVLQEEAQRLAREGRLKSEQVDCLDFQMLAGFWASPLGSRIREQAPFVRRELAFTARFPANDLNATAGQPADPGLEGEFTVVQGVADLVVLLPREIWLVDFKTDKLKRNELEAKAALYATQLRLYGKALGGIYRRPVTERWLYFLNAQAACEVPAD